MADPIFSAHVMGAFPRFLSWVQSQINDFKRVMEYIPCQEDEITTIDDFEEENNMRAKANIFGKEWKKRFTSSQHAFCYLLEGN
jgi:hypothetical protein